MVAKKLACTFIQVIILKEKKYNSAGMSQTLLTHAPLYFTMYILGSERASLQNVKAQVLEATPNDKSCRRNIAVLVASKAFLFFFPRRHRTKERSMKIKVMQENNRIAFEENRKGQNHRVEASDAMHIHTMQK